MPAPIAPEAADLTRAERRFVWAPVVTVDSVDITDQVRGQIEITFAENASTIAKYSYIPDDGQIDLLSLVGLAVTIDHYEIGPQSDPTQPWIQRRFTGVIARPVYNVEGGYIDVQCTSDLQGHIEGLTRSAIDSLVGGEYSEHIFKSDGDNWQYALDRLSTRPSSMWHDAAGNVTITDWAAKGTPDFTIADDLIKPGSIVIESASKRELVNRVLIDLDYRFWNLRQRELTVNWAAPANFCDYLTKGFNLPSKEMILSAMQGTGWNIDTYGWGELPESTTYYCPIDPWLWIKTPAAKRKCISATFDVDRRWGQRVTEQYQLDVKSAESITASGEMGVAEAYGVESEYDISEWEAPREHHGRITGASLHGGGSGDYSREADPDARTDMENAQTCVLAKARTEILGSHRGTRYTFETPLHPFVDLSQTVRVTYQATGGPEQYKHKVTGKIAGLVETLDVATGSALSRVTLAVSMHGGVGVDPDSPLDPPTQPTPDTETPFTPTVSLGFRLGPYNEPGGSIAVENLGEDDYNGYTTNEARTLAAGEQYYDEGITVIIPEIEQAAVDSTVLAETEVYTVTIPQDEFEIYK